ncbi:MAG: hypothetical protein QG591_2921 [Planctomycetota bacterium]|nr:hypothetical protein [Planctomycetota bacterium]
MSNDRYKKVAQLVKGIFEKEFGKLSTEGSGSHLD